MEYLTVKEVAELKGCSERYIKKIVQNGKLEALTETNEKNRPKYLIPVSALPEELKAKYYKQKQKELGLLPELKEEPLEQRSKAVKKPVKPASKKKIDEYTSAEREEIALWCEILKEWQAARSKFKNVTEADPLFCSKIKLEHPDIDINPDILYRKYAAYRENNLDGLVDKRGGWNKGKCSINPEVFSIFTSYYLTTHRLSVENCYNKTVAVCKEY